MRSLVRDHAWWHHGGIALLTVVMVLASLGATMLTAPRVALAASAVATADVAVRAGAGDEYDIVTTIPTGAEVSIDGDAVDGFFPVTYTGISGWTSAAYLSPVSETAPPAADESNPVPTVIGTMATTSDLNLRAGPSITDASLLVIPRGAAVDLTGSQIDGYAEVSYNGTIGWVSSQYLTDDPVAAPDPALAAEPAAVPAPAPAPAATATATTTTTTTDSITQIIYDAADRYGQPREDMLRVAQCESNLDPNAVNGPGNTHGLFQFLPSTFATTPYADSDIYDPWANANAAGWMWSVGRRGEWVCQ